MKRKRTLWQDPPIKVSSLKFSASLRGTRIPLITRQSNNHFLPFSWALINWLRLRSGQCCAGSRSKSAQASQVHLVHRHLPPTSVYHHPRRCSLPLESHPRSSSLLASDRPALMHCQADCWQAVGLAIRLRSCCATGGGRGRSARRSA